MAPKMEKTHLIPFELWYEDFAPGYPTIRISNDHASATIALHGAHVIDFIPRDQEPVIFTSREALFTEGKAIRGGIPVCWPWFGAHPSDSTMPAHGVARNRFWQITSTRSSVEFTEVVLSLQTEAIDILTGSSELELTIKVGAELSLELTTTNTGTRPLVVGGALHSYLYVGDIKQTSITGLEGTNYLDTLSDTQQTQNGQIKFDAETDSIYENTDGSVTIHDPVFKRTLLVDKSGSLTTVIWNPWIKKSAGMADLADDEYMDFVCVEAVNTGRDMHTLSPGASHTLGTTISSIKSID